MNKLLEELSTMPGRNKGNIFVLLIVKLSTYQNNNQHDINLIHSLTKEIRILFNNHSQNLGTLSFFIKQNLAQFRHCSPGLILFLNEVVKSLEDHDLIDFFSIKEIEKSDIGCNIQRLFESSFAINVLDCPSDSVWNCIKKISNKIIEIIEKNTDGNYYEFLANLGPNKLKNNEPNLALAFGRFTIKPTLEDVLDTLRENKNIHTILLIHFMFVRDVYMGINEIYDSMALTQYHGTFQEFYKKNNSINPKEFFCNYPKYEPTLYTDRGRAKFSKILSNNMGIMLDPEDRNNFPKCESTWFPDCLCQEANLNSPYVKSLITQDIPYVSGPSGMTSIFCAVMVFLSQFKHISEYQAYMLAFTCFIIAGGLHNMHEVLSVIQMRLGLLPAYKPCGNYNSFFELFSHDEAFQHNYRNSWNSVINWVKENYPELIIIESIGGTMEISGIDLPAETKNGCHCIIG